jgi:hypothetical protein
MAPYGGKSTAGWDLRSICTAACSIASGNAIYQVQRNAAKRKEIMLKALLLSFTLALAVMAMAQTNLVQNPSYEETINCSTHVPGMLKARYWYNPNIATPDIWDCDLERQCGITMSPTHWATAPFFQFSQNGLRHAGIYTWYGPGSSGTREYLMTPLAEPLMPGVVYDVSLWYARKRTFIYAVDHIGVWFGMDSIYEATPNWLSVTPQVKLRDPDSDFLVEDQLWTELKDTYHAQGGEQWMIIGNFDVADSVNGITIGSQQGSVHYAYYFIDQVLVVPRDVIHSIAPQEGLNAIWGSDGLWLRWPEELRMEHFHLMDALGRIVRSEQLMTADARHLLPVKDLAPGVYVVVVTGMGTQLAMRMVKEE